MRLRSIFALATPLVAVFCFAVGTEPAAAQSKPLPIRVGWAETPGHLAPLVAALAKKHPDIMPNNGKTYDFEPVRYPGSTPQIQALAIHDLEIAAFSDSAFALAVTNAHLDVQIVADVIQTGHPGYFPGEYVVAKDGPIKTIDDLRGKRVATNAIGSEADSTMRAMLRRHHIQDKDFTTVEANFANQPAMLQEGKVDMIELLPQFASDLMATGKYKILFTGVDVHGLSEAVFWCMRRDFIAAHKPVLVDFFTDYMRAVRWFLTPKNRDEAVALTVAVTHKTAKQLDFAFTKHDFYHDPGMVPDVGAVQREIDEDVKLGVLPKKIQVSPKYVDLSLIKAAKERLDGHGA
ncbi:MAG TPA: ABC transporter substrate-binding protein [Stellaceae bacterium]|nr:ABC transporter substrate-binding protein [Stellaceae bacterium]